MPLNLFDPKRLPVKGEQPKHLCATCIHKCVFKDVILCNISINPTIFNGTNNVPVTECIDYSNIEYAYPKINIHGLWVWDKGNCVPTPIILACDHKIPEYEQQSIEELYQQCFTIAKGYGIKLKGFPWIINIAEISKNGIKKTYRTKILPEEEITRIINEFANKNK